MAELEQLVEWAIEPRWMKITMHYLESSNAGEYMLRDLFTQAEQTRMDNQLKTSNYDQRKLSRVNKQTWMIGFKAQLRADGLFIKECSPRD